MCEEAVKINIWKCFPIRLVPPAQPGWHLINSVLSLIKWLSNVIVYPSSIIAAVIWIEIFENWKKKNQNEPLVSHRCDCFFSFFFAAALIVTHPVRTQTGAICLIYQGAQSSACCVHLFSEIGQLRSHVLFLSTRSVRWAPQDRSPSPGSSNTWSTVSRRPHGELSRPH